jgi:AcrR family transcriptional regulator
MPPIAKTSAEQLLNAAQIVILRDGILSLTLDAVAREAGVSKGGLLHYFPNKNALLEGMISTLLKAFESEIEQQIAADPVIEGRFCRAYIAVSLQQETPEEAALTTALLAAATTVEPQILTLVRDRYAGWKARALTDGLDPETATLVFFAADGFWFARMLGLGQAAEAAAQDSRLLVRAVSRLIGVGPEEKH